MQHNSPLTPTARKKLPARFSTVVFSFYMAALMTCFMCFVIVGANTGLHNGYLARVWHTYQFAMPVAFICVLIVRPIALKLLDLTVEKR
jgi:hypothetical protein